MAKSLRSKWRRKCRAAKREKYGIKELARLKKTLGITEESEAASKDAVMQDISTITLTVDANTIKKTKAKKTTMNIIKQDEDSDMEEDVVVQKDGESEPRVYNSKTMRDQYGQYPVWMHQRKIKASKNPQNKKTRQSSRKVTKKKSKKRTKC